MKTISLVLCLGLCGVASADARIADLKPSAELTRLLSRAPREVRRALAPTARIASHSTPFGGSVPNFDVWNIWTAEGHHLAIFTGEGGRASIWLYYRGNDTITLTDHDRDGIADERSRETMDGDLRTRTVVEVRSEARVGGSWRTSLVSDYGDCQHGANYRETLFLPSGKKKVKWSACIIS